MNGNRHPTCRASGDLTADAPADRGKGTRHG